MKTPRGHWMLLLLAVLSVLLPLLSIAVAEEAAEAQEAAEVPEYKVSNVLVLDEANFEHLTQAASGATTGDWLVEFYSRRCGHCKEFAPAYEQVADELQGLVNVAKIDSPANPRLRERFDIRAYPALLLLRHGKMYKYSGPRTFEAVERFARSEYKSVEAKPVPSATSLLEKLQSYAEKVREDLMARLAAKEGVLGAPWLIGSLVCILVLALCIAVTRGSKTAKAKTS